MGKKHAEFDELQRAANIDTSSLYEAYVDDVDDVNRTWVARAILADPDWDANSWEEQRLAMAELFEVEEDMVESVVTTEFIEGFLEGAGDVWHQVKDEL